MTKRKDHSVLFEVISRSREVQKPLNDQPAEQQKADQQATEPLGKLIPPTAAPVVDKAGGVLSLSLTYSTCLAIAAGVIIVLLGVFMLGRATVGTKDTEPGRQQQTSQGQASRAVAVKPIARESGKYYLVIESLKRSDNAEKDKAVLAEAMNIARFCSAKGYPADVKYFDNKKYYIVWSGIAFDSPRSSQAKDFARTVQDRLGKEYFEEHRNYRFLQERNGEFDPMFLQQR